MRSPHAKTAIAALVTLAMTFVSCVSPPDPEPPWRGPRLVLLGANGRHLGPGEPYSIPLGGPDRALPLHTPVREALAVRNEGDVSLTLEGLWLVPLGGTRPGELTLLTPRRAADVPLALEPTTLRPGEQLDFDLGVRLAASGIRRAALTARWVEGADVAVEVRALGAGSERLWDPAAVLPSARIAAGSGPDLELRAASVANDNVYVTARGVGGAHDSAAIAARILPDGRVAWEVAIAAVAGADFAPQGICAGEQSVVVVGHLDAPRAQAAAVALDTSGGLRWTRTWEGSPAADGGSLLHCSIKNARVWLAGTESDTAGGTPVRSLVLAASLSDGAPSGSWRTEAQQEAVGVADLAVTRDGGGSVVAEVRGKIGAVTWVAPDGSSTLALPGPAAALALLPEGDVAVAWREPEVTSVGRVGAGGTARWTTTLPALDAIRVRVDGASVVVAGDDGRGLTVAWLGASDGALQKAASLYLAGGNLELGAVSVGRDGLRLVGLGDTDGDGVWYEAAPAWAPRGVRVFPARSGALAPVAGRWDAVAASARPVDDLLRAADRDATAALLVTGLRRSGSE